MRSRDKRASSGPSRTRRRLSWRSGLFLLVWCVFSAATFRVASLQFDEIKLEHEAPLDHAVPFFLKPIYGLSCPKCKPVQNTTSPKKQVFMISARAETTVESWNTNLTQAELIPTLELSQSYNNTRCQTSKWHNRLFFVYQQVFQRFLDQYPNDPGFVIVEDDALLLSGRALPEELCIARQYDFYSFFQTPQQGDGCLYEYGMVAFYMKRNMMKHLLALDDTTFCRLPIDIYLASIGPWYASARPVVQHTGTRVNLNQEAKKKHKEARMDRRRLSATSIMGTIEYKSQWL